jgi:hypothetical protein
MMSLRVAAALAAVALWLYTTLNDDLEAWADLDLDLELDLDLLLAVMEAKVDNQAYK